MKTATRATTRASPNGERSSTEKRKVLELARELEKKGYTVRSHAGGRPTPRKIGGFVPDIEAVKDNNTIIVEVKTLDSLREQIEKAKALAQYASEASGTEFRLVLTRPRKRTKDAQHTQ